ncbi:hypothetical protein DFH28DRAFT_921366 [Melampsora americana]|nr:hypothetical protein DFH28DRAFT_921366 [Melampsora americana]
MWKLSSCYPILQDARDTLPHPRPGILAGFGCPACYKTSSNKQPLEYTKRDGHPHLIGLRVICRTNPDFKHFFQTPCLKDVIDEVNLYNQQLQGPHQFSRLLNPEFVPISGFTQSSPSTSNVSQALFVCHGVDGKYVSEHCKQRQTCSHHCSQIPPSASSTAPIASKARHPDIEVDNHVLSEQPQSRAINRRVNPQADRHAIRDLPLKAVAHHNAAQQRTQAAKDKVDLHELTLRAWLKVITLCCFRSLQQMAHDLLGPSWDLELKVLRPGSLKWQLVDANIPLMYPLHTTKLLIRKMGLPVGRCLGIVLGVAPEQNVGSVCQVPHEDNPSVHLSP